MHLVLNGPTDQRVLFKHADGLNDFADTGSAVIDCVLGKVVKDALKVFCDLWSKLDSRHRLA